MYRIIGAEVKHMVQEVDGLKPNLMQTISKRMNQLDNGAGGKQYMTGSIIDANKSGTELEQIPEANDEEADMQVRRSQMSLAKVSDIRKSQDSQIDN